MMAPYMAGSGMPGMMGQGGMRPGVMPGNDLIGPLREAVRDPRRLLDGRPRRIPGGEDPDLERFNRLYERGLELPRKDVP